MKRVDVRVLAIAILLAVSSPCSASDAADRAESVFLEGTARVLVACDLENATATYDYWLVTDNGEEIGLDLKPEGAPGLRTGDRIRLRGQRELGRFHVEEMLPIIQARTAEGRTAYSAWTTGTRRVLVILIKFPDDASTPYTQAAAQGVFFGNSTSVKNLYAEASYGATQLVGDVTPWLTATVSKPTTCDTGTVESQANAQAQAAGYNLSNYDFLIWAHTSLSACGWAGLGWVGGSGAWINGGYFSTLVVGHELGHNFGLSHAHSLACTGRMFVPACATTGSRSEYGDWFDTMGNGRSGHFSSYAKSSLGWMPAGSVATVSSGVADFDLSPFEGTSGLRAIKVPTAVSSRTFWIEFRQPIGFDAGFPSGGMTGAQIRIGPSNVGGSDLLDAVPSSSTFDDAALAYGQTFVDVAANLLARVVSLTGTGPSATLRVHVQFGGAQEALRGDFGGDGRPDIVWRNTVTGENAIWFMNGPTVTGGGAFNSAPIQWSAAGAGDFNGDGRPDIVWRNPVTGENAIWYMNGATPVSSASFNGASTQWSIVGIGDFNGDGKPDIVWRNTVTGENAIWYMNGATPVSMASLSSAPTQWSIVGTGDFNGDGKPDIVWRNTTTGENAIWYMNGATPVSSVAFNSASTQWSIVAIADFNGDGKPDIVWRNYSTGADAIWYMNGATPVSSAAFKSAPPVWSIVGPK